MGNEIIEFLFMLLVIIISLMSGMEHQANKRYFRASWSYLVAILNVLVLNAVFIK